MSTISTTSPLATAAQTIPARVTWRGSGAGAGVSGSSARGVSSLGAGVSGAGALETISVLPAGTAFW
ncbi:MAG TPA: hypothetical protein VLR70_01310 [Arthrobacter sp.]|nr:hypothetical protein [Arthrobacter sp.]